MTVFFNNDGSILITTPIIIEIVSLLNLKPHQKLPYLLSGALIATASSAPIGVSNLANLISLKIVNLDLVRYAELMFIPSMIGLICMCLLLFAYFKKDVPIKISSIPKANIPLEIYNVKKISHPLLIYQERNSADWSIFKTCMIIIILVRCSFFVLSYFHIPIEWAAIIGALVLIMIRWHHYGIRCNDIIKKTPWHIFLFAMSMYIIVYGMHVSGLTSIIIDYMRVMLGSIYNAILSTGLLISFMSNIFNNLPSILIGTIIITNLGLDQQTLHVLYLATIIGSDIGSFVMPIGTLATLIWMFILKINKIPIPWKNYISVTSITIPISLLVTLLCLHLWTQFVFI